MLKRIMDWLLSMQKHKEWLAMAALLGAIFTCIYTPLKDGVKAMRELISSNKFEEEMLKNFGDIRDEFALASAKATALSALSTGKLATIIKVEAEKSTAENKQDPVRLYINNLSDRQVSGRVIAEAVIEERSNRTAVCLYEKDNIDFAGNCGSKRSERFTLNTRNEGKVVEFVMGVSPYCLKYYTIIFSLVIDDHPLIANPIDVRRIKYQLTDEKLCAYERIIPSIN